MLTVIAEIRTRPGQHHRQAVLDQFAKIIPTVLQEAGCHGYAPLVDHAAGVSFQTTAPDSIVMVEQWESVAHLEAHLQTPHMKAWSEAVKGDVLETSIRILQEKSAQIREILISESAWEEMTCLFAPSLTHSAPLLPWYLARVLFCLTSRISRRRCWIK